MLEKMRSALRDVNTSALDKNDKHETVSGVTDQKFYKFKFSLHKVQARFLRIIMRLLPSNEKNSAIAKDIFHLLLVSNKFILNLVKIRPYFGIKLIELEIAQMNDFFYNYLKTMVVNTDSILYYELKNSCNVDSQLNYFIPASNRFLAHVLDNAKNAENLHAWKPVGDAIIIVLDDIYKSNRDDPYNMPLDDFDSEDKWKSPIFAGIRFFDIMVSKAIHQNIKWHMWLYYFEHWTERICRNYNPNQNYVDLNSEFPTKYSYLLYEIISVLRSWIRLAEILPEEKPNFQIHKNNLETENSSILKCCILCLGRSIGSIVTCKSISLKFKKYILEMFFNLYFDMRVLVGKEICSQVLLNSVINQGSGYRKIDESYIGTIISAFIENDNIPFKVEYVNEAIQIMFNSYYNKFGLGGLNEYVDFTNQNGTVILTNRYGGEYRVELPV
jgi:hypothetical protein